MQHLRLYYLFMLCHMVANVEQQKVGQTFKLGTPAAAAGPASEWLETQPSKARNWKLQVERALKRCRG